MEARAARFDEEDQLKKLRTQVKASISISRSSSSYFLIL